MDRQYDRAAKEAPKLQPLFPMAESMERASPLQMHLEQTGALLRQMLLRRDYGRAYRLYNIILSSDLSESKKSTPGLAEEIAWKVRGVAESKTPSSVYPIGSELLQQKEEYDPQLLKFLQLILIRSRFCREQILLEVMLYHLRCGEMKGACAIFEPYTELAPYNENPVLLGYAGPVHFAIWKKAFREWREQSGEILETDDTLDEWHDDDPEDTQGVTSPSQEVTWHASSAIRFIERALEKDPTQDMFLIYLVRLKCGQVPPTGFDPQIQLLLAALENRQKLKTLELILQHDPASNSELYVKAYIDLLEKAMPQDQQDFLKPTAFSHLTTIERVPLPVQTTQQLLLEGNWRYRLTDFRPELAANGIQTPFRAHGDQVRLSNQCQRNRQAHQPDVKHFRPILMCLLTRAEFDVMTEDEEEKLVSICDLFCFCSLYCRRVSSCDEVPQVPKTGSYLDDLPDDKRPPWYSRLAAILSCTDEA
ncbi:hypothetical protein EC968_007616 [Mortierella alpina]|nr:hypothetical protein EC968_007616 [Mortierella alpina]